MTKIAVVGGGLTGLLVGYELVKKNYEVSIFEKDASGGGLLQCFPLADTFLEKYYHHLFIDDHEIIDLLQELGIKEKLLWQTTKTGIYYREKIHSFSGLVDILKYSPLTWKQRWRFMLVMGKLLILQDWEKLEKVTAHQWLAEHLGEDIFTKIWVPLLKGKFSHEYKNISLAWFWARLKSRIRLRFNLYGREKLGYLEGSFKILIDALAIKIIQHQGQIYKETEVIQITPTKEGKVEVYTPGNTFIFDKVILTIPAPEILKIMPSLSRESREKYEKIEYLATLTMVLILKHRLTDFYWLNINDEKFPFIGVIEHTNFINKKLYSDENIVYIANYLSAQDRFFHLKDEEILNLYLPFLAKINVCFKPDWIKKFWVFRDIYAQPVVKTDYVENIPSFNTSCRDIYLVNNSQIYPQDRGINNTVKLINKFMKLRSDRHRSGI